MPTNPDPANDPDVTHMLDLLSILPGPAENPAFWAGVQAAAKDHELTPENLEPTHRNLDYVFPKMSGLTFFLRDPKPATLTYLCKYLLWFFSGDRPEVWKVLNGLAMDESRWGHDDSGRWWAEDLTRVTWVLYVRYRRDGDDRWRDKWSFDKTWLQWLPDRGEPEA